MAGVSASRRRCGRCWAQRRAAWPSGAAEGTTWRPTRLTALSDKAEKICRTCSICLLLFCGSALIPKVGQQERKIQTSSNSMFVSWGFCFHLVSSTQQQNQYQQQHQRRKRLACSFFHLLVAEPSCFCFVLRVDGGEMQQKFGSRNVSQWNFLFPIYEYKMHVVRGGLKMKNGMMMER